MVSKQILPQNIYKLKKTYKVRIVADPCELDVQVVGEVLDHVAMGLLLLGLPDEAILPSDVPGNRVRLGDLKVVTLKINIEKIVHLLQ